MSLFRGENVYPTIVQFNAASQTPTPVIGGTLWYDPSQHTMYIQAHGVQASVATAAGVNTTAATAANPSSTANLMSVAIPANVMNVANKTMKVVASGVYNFGGGTNAATLTFNVALGATGVLSFVSGATTNTATAMPWKIEADIITLTTGASGAVVADGKAMITLGTNATAATTTYVDIPAGNVAYNCQQVTNVQVSVLCSVSSATTNVVQQLMIVEIEN